MKLAHSYFLIIIFTCLIQIHCKGSMDAGGLYFTGITQTDEVGNIIEDDPDDWQPRYHMLADFGVGPAYPNPFNDTCIVVFRIHQAMDVKITVNDTPTHIVFTLVNELLDAGIWKIIIDLKDHSSGIYRVYITAKTHEGNTYTSYGDIHLIK